MDIDKKRSSGASSGSRTKPLQESFVEPSTYGTVVDMSHFTAGGQNVICFATTRGKLCGLDLRSNEHVWELTNNPKFGKSVFTLNNCTDSVYIPCLSTYNCLSKCVNKKEHLSGYSSF